MQFLCLFVLLVTSVYGHVYLSGSRCPNAPPMQDFNMEKFLGVWYAIEKSRSFSECLTYSFSHPDAEDHPDDYRLEQTSIMMRSQVSYTGRIKAPSRNSSRLSGHMTVQFPLNMIGRSSFQVFSTDYETFAGIYTCQPLMFLHRHSVTLLSRTKELDENVLRDLRYRMYDSNIHSLDLRSIEQQDCAPSVESQNPQRAFVKPAGWAKYHQMSSFDRDADSHFKADEAENTAAEDADNTNDQDVKLSPKFGGFSDDIKSTKYKRKTHGSYVKYDDSEEDTNDEGFEFIDNIAEQHNRHWV